VLANIPDFEISYHIPYLRDLWDIISYLYLPKLLRYNVHVISISISLKLENISKVSLYMGNFVTVGDNYLKNHEMVVNIRTALHFSSFWS